MRVFILFLVLVAGATLALDHFGRLEPYKTMLLDKIPVEPLVRAEIRDKSSSDDLSARVDKALSLNDYDEALIYAEISEFAGLPLHPETRQRLEGAGSLVARTTRATGHFIEGFVTGESMDSAGLAGSVASDLTVVGDVRDISVEGGKMLAGEDYSSLILGLSVVGLTATGATVATGGGGLPARIGVSLLKVARKAGMLTANFARHLGRLVEEAVDFERLRGTLSGIRLSDPAAARAAINSYADHVKTSKLFPVFADMERLHDATGTSEAVRLMRYVESERDLANIATMGEKFGRKTRGIIKITGRTSLRAFKVLTSLLLWMGQWVWAVIAGLGGLIATWLGRRAIRGSQRARPA
jgi:hypothetical protein